MNVHSAFQVQQNAVLKTVSYKIVFCLAAINHDQLLPYKVHNVKSLVNFQVLRPIGKRHNLPIMCNNLMYTSICTSIMFNNKKRTVC